MSEPENKNESRLSPARVRLTWTASLASAAAVFWPVGDLVYKHGFTTPGFWWLLVLGALAAWIMVAVLLGLDRILDRFDELAAKTSALSEKTDVLADKTGHLEERIAEYGDVRESDGHVAALRINGHGPVGHLTLVD